MRQPRHSLWSLTARSCVAVLVATVLVVGPLAEGALAAAEQNNPAAGAGGGFPPVAVVADLGRVTQGVWSNIYTQLTRAAVLALFNSLQTFLGQLAYDAADYIASGGQGQAAVFYKKGFGGYIQDVASDAAGEFVASLSDGQFFRTAGFNLCQPDARMLLRLQLSLGNFFPGLQGRFTRPRPRCDFKQIINNYERFAGTLSNADILKNIQLSLNTNTSDLGASLNILNQFNLQLADKVNMSKLERQEGGGFKSIVGAISGNIKTPSQVVGEATKENLVRFPNQAVLQSTGAIFSNAFEMGFVQLMVYTGSVFLNTLASKMLRRLFEQGIDAGLPSLGTGPEAVIAYSKTDARAINNSLKTPNLQNISQFEVLGEMGGCPTESRGLWNCTVDQAFIRAVQRDDQGSLTVAAALRENFLHGSWKLIPMTEPRQNQEVDCYTKAYCAGNLQKLRLMRFLPVGFEFAANAPENISRCRENVGCITLQEVVDGFVDCNASGARDNQHPWCHLIDPNWVLASLPQQCALKGFSDQLLSSTLGQRREECQDVQTCLKRNDRGECVGGYGYCLAEKTVYRFGADECLPRYASCRNYQTRTGLAISYKRQSLDYGECSADNVGCLWYATTRDPSLGNESWIGTTSTGPRTYFDNTLEACAAGDEGCTKLRQITVGRSALNLIVNPSFEKISQDTPGSFVGWQTDQTILSPPVVTAGSAAWSGSMSADATGNPRGGFGQSVKAYPARAYTLSLYVRAKNATTAAGVRAAMLQEYRSPSLHAYVPVPISSVRSAYRSGGCELAPTGEIFIQVANAAEASNSTWRRFECTFVTASSTEQISLLFGGINVLVDGVQLEEGEYATDFVDGFDPALPETSMRVAPDEFACAGDDSDHALCAKFARVCRQPEAGCDGYTDTASGIEVPAIVSSNDICPASCVGYSEYRKGPSAFDLVHEVDARFDDPQDTTSTFFIARTAAACTQADVGCEAFTNVEAAASGGEQQAFFSYVRSCRKPGPDSQTFFTWEGSDTSGFQLRTWSLIRDRATPPGPLVIAKRPAGQAMFKDPSACSEAAWRDGDDADCRQFYDVNGNPFYRFYSQTVLSTPECKDFRLNQTNRQDCEKTDGVFTPGTGECLYRAFMPESRLCRAEAVGCRAYRGAGAGNVQAVLTQDFRQSTGTFIGGRRSNESVLLNDSSLRLDSPANGSAETSVTIFSTSTDLFTLSFWAKASIPSSVFNVTLRNPDDLSSSVVIGNVTVTGDWQRYTVGPFNGFSGASLSKIRWKTTPRPSAFVMFLDEVHISRIQDTVYVRRNTWNTPLECDQTIMGATQPQAMLGCRSYRTRRNQTVNVREFSRLCRERAIGCTAFVDTRNSNEVGEQTFERTGLSSFVGGLEVPLTATTTRPADRYLYLIDEPSKHCAADQASCRAFGRPRFTADRTALTGFSTVYVKDDITKYEQALCKPSETFCEEFSFGGAKEYFHDPATHACEYREDVDAPVGYPSDHRYSGWFQVGVSPARPCYPELLESGRSFGLANRGDAGYRGWGGLCPANAGECTELRDGNDRSNPRYPSGQPYYFIRNDKLDTTSCAGSVDVGNGCILLRDTADTELKYNASASYARYQANRSRPVAALDCERNSLDPLCVAQQSSRNPCTRDSSETYCRNDVHQNHCLGRIAYYLDSAGTTLDPAHRPEEMRGDPLFAPGNPEMGNYGGTDISFCRRDEDCNTAVLPTGGGIYFQKRGTCSIQQNDSNLIVKVNMDRDCAEWLGCSSSEVVFDPASNRYRDLCTNLALCDKASGINNDAYCASYVDRSSTSTEPILTQGRFFDLKQYASRKVGLGERDYAGYAVPNTFLAPDLANARVAADGLKADVRATSRFVRDYRLTAVVPMPPSTHTPTGQPACPGDCYTHTRPPRSNEAVILDSRTDIGSRNNTLHLCRHEQSGRIGYFKTEEISAVQPGKCYLPTSIDPAVSAFIDGATTSTVSSFDFQTLSEKFNLADPDTDTFLRRAFPAPECRANPEMDAPFPTSAVLEWDLTKNPPKPVRRVGGLSQVNLCEYGEQCSCTYKRADYSGAAVSKFYTPFSQNIPAGVCQGGPRDGQACIPSIIFDARGSTAPTTGTPPTGGTAPPGNASRSANQLAAEAANTAQSCGPAENGGRCVALSKVEEIRGVFGECLERDTTRSGINGEREPCLTWNPSPVLFGDKDPYHYVPTSGYLPPPSTGQYYCTSLARQSTTIRLTPSSFATTTDSMYAGQMSTLYYDDNLTSDEHNSAASIDGQKTDGSQVAKDCEDADDDQDNDGHNADIEGLRLVGTGHVLEESYAETFFPLNAPSFIAQLFNTRTLTPQIVQSGLSDANIGFIRIAPFENQNGMGRIACGYQADWVDGLRSVDYNDPDSSKPADKEWRQKFFETYNPVMTRGSEQLLAGTDNHPLTIPCVRFNGIEDDWQSCYYKTWQLGYRLENQSQAFGGLVHGNTVIGGSFDDIQQSPIYQRCDSDKPYFGIRAVFEAKAVAGDFSRANPPSGPWRLVGFWVASCAGAARDVRYMYMNVDITSADICKEIAEVRSHDSLQDAAFTDRVWQQSAFTVPGRGIQYGSRFSPYSSAMTTKSIGSDDQVLFQTGQEIAGFSPLKPPTFIASGADSYYASDPTPKDKWAYLSNLFARIYRIYQYQAQAVTVDSQACLDGPFKGRACDATVPAGASWAQSPVCSLDGECDTTAITRQDLMSLTVCDSFSGINAGLPCDAGDPDVCHSGAIEYTPDGDRKQKLDACVLNNPRWKLNDDGTYDYRPTDANERFTEAQAATAHLTRTGFGDDPAFVCASGHNGLRVGLDCSAPSSASRECPQYVGGKCLNKIDNPSTNAKHFPQGRCGIIRYDEHGVPLSASAQHITSDGGTVQVEDNVIYDLVPSEYASCYGDFDCSFSGYNYYLSRPGAFSTIYSPRSSRNLTGNYGDVATCNDGSAKLDKACLYTTMIETKGCAGGSNSSHHTDHPGDVANQIQPGPGTTGYSGQCVLQAWRYGARCTSDHPFLQVCADQTNACDQGEARDDWLDALAGPSEFDRPVTGMMSAASYARFSLFGMNLNAIRDLANAWRDGYTSVRDWLARAFNTLGGNGEGFLVVMSALEDLVDVAGEIITGVGGALLGECTIADTQWDHYAFGRCITPALANAGRAKDFGRCKGGIYDGKVCFKGVAVGTRYSCKLDRTQRIAPPGRPYPYRIPGVLRPIDLNTIADYEAVSNRCGPVSTRTGDFSYPVADCAINGNPGHRATVGDPDHDNNMCTHGAGYRPRLDICPDPSNEFCGLIAYKIHSPLSESSMDPRNSPFHLPTDVTMGFYTPNYLGSRADVTTAIAYKYIAYYTPVPPRIAAPDIRQCQIPGQCLVQRVNAFSVNGQTEGPLTFSGGQQKSVIRFYAWAAHNQMPLRQLVLDWGDGFKQQFTDARMKNHKPFCGGTKECFLPGGTSAATSTAGYTGLTCDTDSDCPPGYGRCEDLGTCNKHPEKSCSRDVDCSPATPPQDTCNVRTMFGNAPEACESNYFEFSHLYTCTSSSTVGGGDCGTGIGTAYRDSYRCSRDTVRICNPAVSSSCAAGDLCLPGLAPPAGCWDPFTNSCRFTPRLDIQDNWGWCTGECRTVCSNGDCNTASTTNRVVDASDSRIIHKYGGCYAGVPLGGNEITAAVRSNIPNDEDGVMTPNECNITRRTADFPDFRPWIVYPGAIQLRSGR